MALSRLSRVKLDVRLSPADFDRLAPSSSAWAPLSEQVEDGRFEDEDGLALEEVPAFERIYWFGDNYAAVVLARAFLDAIGHGLQHVVVWDTAPINDQSNAPYWGYAIITNYKTEDHR